MRRGNRLVDNREEKFQMEKHKERIKEARKTGNRSSFQGFDRNESQISLAQQSVKSQASTFNSTSLNFRNALKK